MFFLVAVLVRCWLFFGGRGGGGGVAALRQSCGKSFCTHRVNGMNKVRAVASQGSLSSVGAFFLCISFAVGRVRLRHKRRGGSPAFSYIACLRSGGVPDTGELSRSKFAAAGGWSSGSSISVCLG